MVKGLVCTRFTTIYRVLGACMNAFVSTPAITVLVVRIFTQTFTKVSLVNLKVTFAPCQFAIALKG